VGGDVRFVGGAMNGLKLAEHSPEFDDGQFDAGFDGAERGF